jgi:hypothetical protein
MVLLVLLLIRQRRMARIGAADGTVTEDDGAMTEPAAR